MRSRGANEESRASRTHGEIWSGSRVSAVGVTGDAIAAELPGLAGFSPGAPALRLPSLRRLAISPVDRRGTLAPARMTSERPEPAERPDAILGRRLVRNEPDALGGVYDLLSPTVWSMARRAFPQAVAEDVVQDVFMQVWTRRHQFDESRGSLAAWVLRIARNRITDTIRAASARPQLYPYEVDLDSWLEADGEPAPWEHAWLSERRQKLRQAIRGLSQSEQDVLWLAYFGYTQSEISKRLDVPLGTVKTRTRAGLRKLRERLGDQDLLG